VSTTTVLTTIATTIPVTTTIVPTTIATTVPATTTTTVPAIDGAALYASTCQGCHGPLAAPTRPISARTVAGIRNAGMAFGLSDAQLLAIIAVLP
jgi:mono/diheme cytochrome c family protein